MYDIIITGEVANDKRLTTTDKFFYGFLRSLAGRGGQIWAQNAELIDFFSGYEKIGERQLQRTLSKLIEYGYIVKTFNKNKRLLRLAVIHKEVTKMSPPGDKNVTPYKVYKEKIIDDDIRSINNRREGDYFAIKEYVQRQTNDLRNRAEQFAAKYDCSADKVKEFADALEVLPLGTVALALYSDSGFLHRLLKRLAMPIENLDKYIKSAIDNVPIKLTLERLDYMLS